jgi:hypothetical protein
MHPCVAWPGKSPNCHYHSNKAELFPNHFCTFPYILTSFILSSSASSTMNSGFILFSLSAWKRYCQICVNRAAMTMRCSI